MCVAGVLSPEFFTKHVIAVKKRQSNWFFKIVESEGVKCGMESITKSGKRFVEVFTKNLLPSAQILMNLHLVRAR